jgi:hypothetical protein
VPSGQEPQRTQIQFSRTNSPPTLAIGSGQSSHQEAYSLSANTRCSGTGD